MVFIIFKKIKNENLLNNYFMCSFENLTKICPKKQEDCILGYIYQQIKIPLQEQKPIYGFKLTNSRINRIIFYQIIEMYRVIVKIKRIKLHIKEPVVIEIKIKQKHNDKVITVPGLFTLIEGQSVVNMSYEFHISEKRPKFDICLVLCLNHLKKLAGVMEINLKNLPNKRTLQIQDNLLQCPDKNSIIQFQLMYMDSDINFLTLDLISEQEVQSMKTMITRSQIQEQKRLLDQQNKFLEKQFKDLLQQNKNLSIELDRIQDVQNQIQRKYQMQIQYQQKKYQQTINEIQNQRLKLSSIINFVNQSGDLELIQKIQEIINHKQ